LFAAYAAIFDLLLGSLHKLHITHFTDKRYVHICESLAYCTSHIVISQLSG